MKRIGWIGIVDDKPFWEDTVDDYAKSGNANMTVEIFKSKKEARKRFEAIQAVFIEEEK